MPRLLLVHCSAREGMKVRKRNRGITNRDNEKFHCVWSSSANGTRKFFRKLRIVVGGKDRIFTKPVKCGPNTFINILFLFSLGESNL